MDKMDIVELRVDDIVQRGEELYRVLGIESGGKLLRLESVRDGKRVLVREKELGEYMIFMLYRDMEGPRRKFVRDV